MLRLRTFGGLSLEGVDGQLTGRAVQPRRLALLTLLAATNHGRGISRDTLQALLWPDSDAESARHCLYQAMHVLRHDLGPDDLILGAAELRLNPERIQSDVAELQAGLCGSGEIVKLYGGPFLEGFYLRDAVEFDQWVESRRSACARVWRGAVECLAERATAAGNPRDAAEWWRRLTDADPLDEKAALGLVSSLAAAGNRSGSLVQAERHIRAMDEDLGVAPDSAFLALCQRLRDPPLSQPHPVRSAIPEALTLPVSHSSDTIPDQAKFSREALSDTPELDPTNPLAGGGRQRRLVTLASIALGALGVIIVQPEHRAETTSPARTVSVAEAGTSGPRLAVLPFTNLGTPSDRYFVDGLRDEIASRLVMIPQIAVIGRTSVTEYRTSPKPLRTMAKELGVEYLLMGSVSWTRSPTGESQIRVIPQLVRASDGQQLWANRFEGRLADVFVLQGQIAERTAAALGVALGSPERQRLVAAPTTSLAAYDAYLRGNSYNEQRRYFTIADRRDALAAFERAVALDPTFAAAFGQLVISHLRLYEFEDDRTPARARLAKAALDRAEALSSDAVETRLARADYENTVNGDPEQALLQLQAAEREQPNNVQVLWTMGRSLTAQGKLQQALAVHRRALALDPRAASGPAEVSHIYGRLRRFAEAIEYREQEIALTPHQPGPYVNQAWSYLSLRGDTAAARRMLKRGVDGAGRGSLAEDLARWGGVSSITVPLLDSETVLVLDTISRGVLALESARYHLLKGQLFTLTNRPSLAKPYLDSARVLFARQLHLHPRDQLLWLRLAETYSALGQPHPIIQLAHDILSKTAGSHSEEDSFIVLDTWFALATAYVRAGDRDRALEAFAGYMATDRRPTAAWVRADPIWNSLRTDPRFEQVLAKAPCPDRGPSAFPCVLGVDSQSK